MNIEAVVRLNKTSRETLKTYHEDVNRAISAMHILIDYQKKELEKLKAVTDSLQMVQLNTTSVHDEIFWKRMEDLIRPRGNGFVTASKLPVTPVKTYGKIDESEKLMEPVGRQGRDVR